MTIAFRCTTGLALLLVLACSSGGSSSKDVPKVPEGAPATRIDRFNVVHHGPTGTLSFALLDSARTPTRVSGTVELMMQAMSYTGRGTFVPARPPCRFSFDVTPEQFGDGGWSKDFPVDTCQINDVDNIAGQVQARVQFKSKDGAILRDGVAIRW